MDVPLQFLRPPFQNGKNPKIFRHLTTPGRLPTAHPAESPRPREVVVGLRATTAEASLDSPEFCVTFPCWINPIHPRKFKMEPENHGFQKFYLLFQWLIFRFHVKLQGCMFKYCWWQPEIRRIFHQLRLVDYTIICCKVRFIPGGAGFLSLTVCSNQKRINDQWI